jgi:hypothetical protein
VNLLQAPLALMAALAFLFPAPALAVSAFFFLLALSA